jgi:hypothetical protein
MSLVMKCLAHKTAYKASHYRSRFFSDRRPFACARDRPWARLYRAASSQDTADKATDNTTNGGATRRPGISTVVRAITGTSTC